MHDVDFLKGYTDSPVPRPHGYLAVPGSARRGGRVPVPGLLQELLGAGAVLDARAGAAARGMMVWDLNKKQAVPLHREQVGWHYQSERH